jgi:transcriptional regulator NrdR family protein
MICVNEGCDSHEIKVAETRPHESKNWIKRRRVCKECKCSWWTVELGEFELKENTLQSNG